LRRSGYRKALRAAGLGEINGFYRTGVWSEASGREAVAALFGGKREPPDALFCGNDQIARGAADALREKGPEIAEAAAVVGVDNGGVEQWGREGHGVPTAADER